MPNDKPLPDFKHPPVVEVVLSVQFDALPGLNAFQIATFWTEHLKAEFPDVTEHPPVPNAQETFGAPARGGASISIQAGSPPIRFWMSNLDKTSLVQIQRDRFTFNWRRGDGADRDYPRYHSVREQFQCHFEKFTGFVADNGLGELAFKQCEVTYVNEIRAPDEGAGHTFVGDFLAPHGSTNSEFLKSIESAEVNYHYLMTAPDSDESVGRLHITVNPRFRVENTEAVYLLQLIARGRPLGPELEGALAFLDLGREYIVRGFADVTTPRMHEMWERKA